MNYANIRHNDIANGEGVRTSLFVSGCNFHCPNCFNLEAQDFNYGKYFGQEAKNEIFYSIQDPIISGLSILGGDPLCQDVDGVWQLIELCDMVHRFNKNVWLWSGFTWEEIFDDTIKDGMQIPRRILIGKADVFVDGVFKQELSDRKLVWKGSANQRVIDVQKSLLQGKVVLYGNS